MKAKITATSNPTGAEIIRTKIGSIAVRTDEAGAITSIGLAPGVRASKRVTPTAAQVERQLTEYLEGTRKVFELPLAPRGTPFQLSVWTQLRMIPFGKTVSYSDIARAIGRPAASRAVGAACGRNPIGIVVPCHRVVGSSGALTGYYWGTALKAQLLELEGVDVGERATSLFARVENEH